LLKGRGRELKFNGSAKYEITLNIRAFMAFTRSVSKCGLIKYINIS
jgi:hypothetical protein